MQHAMWVGRHDNQPLGGVAGHLYVEFDGGRNRSRTAYATAATKLATRHPMLRVTFLSDGTQRIDQASEPASFPVTVHDLRDLDSAMSSMQRLAGIREAKSHQQLDGQVFELTLSLLPGESSRLHVDLDMQAADAMSYRTLMADLASLYQGRQLPELGYTYREYRQEIARREAGPQPAHDADRDWWAQRIPELPDPPTAAVDRAERHFPQEHPTLAVAGPGDPRRAVRARPRPRRHPGDDVRRGVRAHAWRAGRAHRDSC